MRISGKVKGERARGKGVRAKAAGVASLSLFRLYLLPLHWIPERAQLFDSHLKHVSTFEPHGRLAKGADAVRSTTRDYVARLQRNPLRQVRDEIRHAEDHL